MKNKIRRYIDIYDEVRYINSNKKYVEATFIDGSNKPKIRLSDTKSVGMFTREEFDKILKDRSWINEW